MKNLKYIYNLNLLPIQLVIGFYLLLFPLYSIGQSVGINSTGAAPDNSALLDLSSTDRGFLITRVDTANIAAPAFGLITLAPIDSCLYLYNGINWISMGGGGNDCSCNCGTPTTPTCGLPFTDARDNKSYGTVQIGKQCWMRENLTYLPAVVGYTTGSTTDPYYYVYGYNGTDVATAKGLNNYITYGVLYNWSAAMVGESSSNANPSGVQGVCPTGFHLPSDEEWKELELFIGIPAGELNNTGMRGTTQGDDLKKIGFAGGTNTTGFTAVPGGYRNNNGYYSEGVNAHWWSSTESGNKAWQRHLRGGSKVDRLALDKDIAVSVRCIKN